MRELLRILGIICIAAGLGLIYFWFGWKLALCAALLWVGRNLVNMSEG